MFELKSKGNLKALSITKISRRKDNLIRKTNNMHR